MFHGFIATLLNGYKFAVVCFLRPRFAPRPAMRSVAGKGGGLFTKNMKRLKLSKVVDILIEFDYLAVIFCLPLYFAYFLKNNDVFELNKIVLFKILVLLLVLLTAIRMIGGSRCLRPYLTIKTCKRYFLIPVLFLLSLTAATVFSPWPRVSLFGLYGRYQGLVSYCFYFLFFLLLCLNLKSFNQLVRIIKAAVLSSFLVSVYGLAQAGGFDFVDWSEPFFISGRITSTLGQPNFLASYLLLVIPLAGFLFGQARSLIIKFWWLVILILNLAALFFTYSRGGWLGLLVGGLVFISVYGLRNRRRWARFKLKIILGFLALALVLTAGGGWLALNNDFFAQRLKSGFDFKSGSLAARLNFWQAGLDAIKARPWLGYGPDGQGDIFAGYYQKNWALYGAVNIYPNRAHNLIIDTVLIGGFSGLFFYLALLYLFFRLIALNSRSGHAGEERDMSAAILIALSAYLASLLFGFAVVVTQVYFWLFLAMMVAVHNNYFRSDDRENENADRHIAKKVFLGTLVLVLGGAVFFQINKEIKILVADYYFQEFKQSYGDRDYLAALEFEHYLETLVPDNHYYRRETALILAAWLPEIKNQLYYQPGKEVLAKVGNSIGAGDYADIFAQAKIRAALGDYERAEEYFNRVIGLSPEMPVNYRALADLEAQRGNFIAAQENYFEALKNLPDVGDSRMNDYHRGLVQHEKYLIFSGLGDLYLRQDSLADARDYFERAYRNYLLDFTLFKKIADIYYVEGDLDTAIFYNQRGMVRSPRDYVWPFALALLYREKGDIGQAEYYGREALELSPDNAAIKEFLSAL